MPVMDILTPCPYSINLAELIYITVTPEPEFIFMTHNDQVPYNYAIFKKNI